MTMNAATWDRLHVLAVQRARELRREASRDFWRGVAALLKRVLVAGRPHPAPLRGS
jgi:hypothetical protein